MLNLPLYSEAGYKEKRIRSARSKINKTVVDLVSSIPSASGDDLKLVLDSILASGTISSLADAHESAGTPDPDPYQEDLEAGTDSTGYAVCNGSSVFKIADSDNVEAVRSMYMTGLSISDIRKRLSSLSAGGALVVFASRSRKKFPSTYDYKKILHDTGTRLYKEYVSVIDDSVYVVADSYQSSGSSSSDCIYAVVCGQGTCSSAYLSCGSISEFPVAGTVTVVCGDESVSVDVDASCASDLVAQLQDLPVTVGYDSGLVFSSDSSFYFIESGVLESMGVSGALKSLYSKIKNGYTGGSLLDSGNYPYNIQVDKPGTSSGGYGAKYSSLVSAGFPSDLAASYVKGDSLYEGVDDAAGSVRSALASDSFSVSDLMLKDTTLYRRCNRRILETDEETIKRLLALSDTDLEYLLKYRTTVRGIDPYCSQNDAADAFVAALTARKSGSSYAKQKEDPWKIDTANARYIDSLCWKIQACSNESDTVSEKEKKDTLSAFLDSMSMLTAVADVYSSVYSYSDTSGSLGVSASASFDVMFGLTDGLSVFSSLYATISSDYLDEFEADMTILQNYMDGAFSAFNQIVSKVESFVNVLNSSTSVVSGTGSLGLNVPGVLQCSLSVSASVTIPPFLSFLSAALVPVVAALEALLEAVTDLENKLLCPIQNLLDKYVNDSDISLPCSVSYSVPTISGISSYLARYKAALSGLRLLCGSVRKDTNWLKYKASTMPGSLNIIVSDSEDCSES